MASDFRKLAAGALLASVAFVSMTPSQDARAAVVQANITTMCQKLPELKAALDYTLKTWPPNAERAQKAGADNLSRLGYFGGMVGSDAAYCGLFTGNAQVALTMQAEIVLGTMQWHFGNASVALQEYQKAVGAQ